jgi:hypothetical protein
MTDRDTLRAAMDKMNTPHPFVMQYAELRNRLALIRQVARHGLRRSPRSKLADQMQFIAEMADV